MATLNKGDNDSHNNNNNNNNNNNVDETDDIAQSVEEWLRL